MKLLKVNAPSAPQSAGGYSQAVEVRESKRFLFVSGQIPQTAAGVVPADFRSQARLVWDNVIAQLQAASMTVPNIVKVTTFLSSRDYATENSEVRRSVLAEHAPALTVIVADIYDAAWLLEIEVVAAD